MASGIPPLPPALLPQFEDALDAFIRTLSPSEKEDFKFTTVADVHYEIGRIQKEQEQKRLLRGLRRIEPFVDGLVRYSGVIEQLVTINPGILAPIWGPLKLILQVTKNAKKPFDTVLTAFTRIGHSLPRFEMFADIFKHSPRISNVLLWLYNDILEFYSEVLKFFRKKPSEKFFSILWSKLDDHLEHLLGNFESHAALVDAEASAADLNEAFTFRTAARQEFLEAAKERERHMLDQAATWLAPLSFEDDFQRCDDIFKSCPNTGQWLLNDSKFKDWVAGSKPVLWLSGIPGSGKTVLSYIVWDFMENQEKSPDTGTLAIFLSDRSREIHSAASVLRTIAYYLIRADMPLLGLFSELQETQTRRQNVKTRKSLETLVERLMSARGLKKIHLIVDGVDEIEDIERMPLLNFLLDLSKVHSGSLNLLISCREEWDIKGKLSMYPRITVNENNAGDIELYVGMETKALTSKFYPYLSAEEARIMLQPLPLRSDGMFLFARLIIFSLKQQTNLARLRDAARDLPQGLDEAYSRIIRRLNDQEKHLRETALSILQYVMCARRPPKLIEMTYALTIQMGATSFDEDQLLIKGLDELCGPILETRKGVVSFVHFSAKEYLQLHESGLQLQLPMAHYAMATRCLTYFLFSCFAEDITDEAIANYIEQGEYLWLDYAQSHWLEHLRAGCGVPDNEIRTLEALVSPFVHRWGRSTEDSSLFWNRNVSFGFNCFEKRCPDEYKALSNAAMYKSQSTTLDVSEDPFLLRSFCTKIWRHLEIIIGSRPPTDPTKTGLHKFYGFDFFRCTEASCSHFLKPFHTATERDTHSKCHERPFKCHDFSCEYSKFGFASASALSKHVELHLQVDHTVNSISNICLAGTLAINSQKATLQRTITSQIRTSWDLICDAIVADNLEIVKNTLFSSCDRTSWPKINESKGIYVVDYSISKGFSLVCTPKSSLEYRNPLLDLAIANGSLNTLRWLLEQGFGKKDKRPSEEVFSSNTNFKLLRYSSDIDSSVILDEIIADVTYEQIEENLETILLLLAHGAKASSRLLKIAVSANSLDLVCMLFKYGADPNEEYLISSVVFESEKSEDMVRLLLDYGVSNESGEFLYWVVMKGSPHITKLLLDRGADPNRSSTDTPLVNTFLTLKPNPETFLITKMLLNSGADPYLKANKYPKDYKVARNFSKHYGITWDEFVEANKQERFHPPPETTKERRARKRIIRLQKTVNKERRARERRIRLQKTVPVEQDVQAE